MPDTQDDSTIQILHRYLVGWLSEELATNVLLGHVPMPTDDIVAIHQTIKQCQDTVKGRPTFKTTNPIQDMDAATADEIKSRPEIQAAFAPFTWRPAMVDLREVLSFQPDISLEGLENRIAEANNGSDSLLELCIPKNKPLSSAGILGERGSHSYTISNVNPNLKVQGSGVETRAVPVSPTLPPVNVLAITFFVGIPMSYLSVVSYNGRYFLRDGYHRAAGLLKADIFTVPCIYVEAKNFEETGANQQQGHLTHEIMYGDRPPKLSDFWDESVSGEGKVPSRMKIIRLKADEFLAQR